MNHTRHSRFRIISLGAALLFTLAGLEVASARASRPTGFSAPSLKATKTATPDPRIIDEGAINDGDSVTGTIDDDHLMQVYTYSGSKGDHIVVTMDSSDGLDPFIAVSTTDGTILKSGGALNGSTTATI